MGMMLLSYDAERLFLLLLFFFPFPFWRLIDFEYTTKRSTWRTHKKLRPLKNSHIQWAEVLLMSLPVLQPSLHCRGRLKGRFKARGRFKVFRCNLIVHCHFQNYLRMMSGWWVWPLNALVQCSRYKLLAQCSIQWPYPSTMDTPSPWSRGGPCTTDRWFSFSDKVVRPRDAPDFSSTYILVYVKCS